jgi:cation transport regulator ChaB
MPYARNSDLPPEVREAYSPDCQGVFRRTWNDTYERSGSEGQAFAVAHTAAQRCEESKTMAEPRLKVAEAVDLSLSEDGSVTVAFAVLGDPADQKAEDIDKDGDVSLVGSLPVGKEVPISSYAHASWPERGGRLPVGLGVISEGKAKGKNLGILTGRFLTDTTHGRDTYLTVKALHSLQEWSFGYVAQGDKGTWAGVPANLNKRYDVYEVSPVLVGAGNGTSTLAVKEGEPLAGLPMADHYLRVLEEIDDFTKRTREIADLREKEGRVLSAANRTRLTALLEALRQTDDFRKEIESLLDTTDPDKIRDEGKALELAFLETQARITSLIHA